MTIRSKTGKLLCFCFNNVTDVGMMEIFIDGEKLGEWVLVFLLKNYDVCKNDIVKFGLDSLNTMVSPILFLPSSKLLVVHCVMIIFMISITFSTYIQRPIFPLQHAIVSLILKQKLLFPPSCKREDIE